MAGETDRSRPEADADTPSAPAPTVVKFSVSRATYRAVDAVRRWERESEKSDLILSGRVRDVPARENR